MRSIAVINQKGGVGKTTSAVNIAAALAESGRRVCLMDLDPQAHASLHLGISAIDGEASMYEVLCGDASLDQARRNVSEQLSVVPANLDLAAAELELAGEVGREMILRDKVDEDDEKFDYMVLDCPPSLGVLTVNALVAVNEVFLPLQPHFLALHGLSKLLRTIEVVSRRLNNTLRLSGVVLCMYDSNTRLAAEVSTDIDEFFQATKGGREFFRSAKFFETRIRRNIRLAEAPSFGKSIFQYAPDSNGAIDYQSLAEEVISQEARTASGTRRWLEQPPKPGNSREGKAPAAPIRESKAPAAPIRESKAPAELRIDRLDRQEPRPPESYSDFNRQPEPMAPLAAWLARTSVARTTSHPKRPSTGCSSKSRLAVRIHSNQWSTHGHRDDAFR